MGLRCVIYDMLLLATAVMRMEHRAKDLRGLKLSRDEAAFVAAALKFRCLYDFITGRKSKYEYMLPSDFGVQVDTDFPKEMDEYRNQTSFFVAHLDWQRATKEKVKQPKPKLMRKHALVLLAKADGFVTLARKAGVKPLPQPRSDNYYRRFREIYDSLCHL